MLLEIGKISNLAKAIQSSVNFFTEFPSGDPARAPVVVSFLSLVLLAWINATIAVNRKFFSANSPSSAANFLRSITSKDPDDLYEMMTGKQPPASAFGAETPGRSRSFQSTGTVKEPDGSMVLSANRTGLTDEGEPV